jgi:hypothetical protein
MKKKFGYTFKILSGYLFDKEFIFKDYVIDLYEIKKNHTKDQPMYLVSKLLMNSLYGRFGMDNKFYDNIIIEDNQLYEFIEKYSINDILQLDNNKTLISFLDQNKYEDNNFDEITNNKISVPVAAAITSYARIHMSQFKSNNSNFKIFYTDTDSIDIDKPLDNKFIGNELGKMKLEHIFKEVVFLAPKVYAGTFKHNNELLELIKIKGFKINKFPLSHNNKIEIENNNINLSFKKMKELLIKNNNLEMKHEKMFRDFEKSNIHLKIQTYNLITTENKRQLIYKNNKLVNTKPFIINKDKLIK